MARRSAEGTADVIASRTDNKAEITVEEMVEWWTPAHPTSGSTVEPLAWSGQIGTATEATIDIRVHVEVEEHLDTTAFGGPSWGAGSATACFRLVWPRYYPASRTEIPCPDGPAPPRPALAPPPELTDEDRAAARAIFETEATEDDIRAALSRAFPEDYIRIEVQQWRGESVVALGISEERECILLVRANDGSVSSPPFRQISLEPGETGCSTGLYTNPPF